MIYPFAINISICHTICNLSTMLYSLLMILYIFCVIWGYQVSQICFWKCLFSLVKIFLDSKFVCLSKLFFTPTIAAVLTGRGGTNVSSRFYDPKILVGIPSPRWLRYFPFQENDQEFVLFWCKHSNISLFTCPRFQTRILRKKSSGYFLFVKKAVVWVIWMCRWDKLNLSLAPAFFQATTYLRLLRLLAKIQEKQQETRGNRRKRRKQEEREETGGSRGKRRKRRKQEKSARMTIWLSNPHAALRFQTKTRNTLKGRIKKCNSKQNYKLKDIAKTIWGEIELKSTN